MVERALQHEIRPRFDPHQPVKWSVPREFEGIMTYNPRHDIQDFLDLANLQGKISPVEFTQRQIQTVNRTKRQLAKNLGERFKVRSSQVEYSIENGLLKSPDYPEPVIQRYEKGREFLAENGSSETQRETAEVAGMRQIERIFSEGKLQVGDKVIIVSPRGPQGSLYNDNYFDVYERLDGQIKMTRYHSTHDYQEFLKAAREVNPNPDWKHTEEIDAAYFLERPIITSLSTDDILETFALDLRTQSEKINQEIVEACTPYINHWIRILIEDPLNIDEIKKTINTIYNVADEAEKARKNNLQTKVRQAAFGSVKQAVNFYGGQPVRTVSFGCPGGQKGFSVVQPSFLKEFAMGIGAKSVIDFSPFAENEDTSDFQCPGYKKDGTKCTYIVRYGSGIRKCPQCGMEATCG